MVVLTGVLVVLVLLLAAWAASAGPDDPFPGTGATPDRITTEPPAEEVTPDTGTPPPRDDEREPGSSPLAAVIGAVVLAAGLALLALLVWFTVAYLRQARTLRLVHRTGDDSGPPDDLEPAEAIATAFLAGAEEQLADLAQGSPRNAVVACWHRFEVQAERAGVPRERWETSAEFTLRLLDLVEADASAVARLSDLYREARFSEHEIDEGARTAALETLEAIHRDLRTLLSGGLV